MRIVIPAPLHAFVDRHRLAFTLCGNILLCAAILAACEGGGGGSTPTGPSNSDQPSSMVIVVTSTPATGNVSEGQTRQYGIQVRNAAGVTLPALTTATWSVSGSGVASISQTGLATCLRAPPGTAAVTVTATGPVGSTYATLSATTSLQCVP